MDDHLKVGLSLTGGGSKGAYQAGMAKALAEFGFPVQEVAGASVGVLNGLVLASAPSLKTGARELERMWLEEPQYLLRLNISGILEVLGRSAATKCVHILRTFAAQFSLPPSFLALLNDEGLLSTEPFRRLLDRCLDKKALAQGLPLYVSVYESPGGIRDILRLSVAELGAVDTAKSTFKHLQAMPHNDQMECLLASIALPIFFGGRIVQGKRYSDGSQGGWQTRQGNTPVEPLIRAGCNLVIVMHSGGGSPWRRQDYPETSFIEIRPQHEPSSIPFRDLLETDKTTLSLWIAQGYEDAKNTIGLFMEASQAQDRLRRSKQELANSESIRLAAERSREAKELRLAEAMKEFKKRT